MPGTIAPFPRHQFFDANGDPLAGAKLFVYEAGTSTKATTYTDVNLGSSNTNPIVLDAAGRCTIFLSPGSYKFVLAPSNDTDPPASPIWTIDNVSSVPSSTVDVDVTGTAGEDLAAGDCAYLSAGDGSRTAGRWYKADADEEYSSTGANAVGFATAAISSGSSGTIRTAGRVTGLASLSVGTVYYISATAGAITATAPTKRRRLGMADSATSLILSHWLLDEPTTLATFVATVGTVGTGEDTLASVTVAAGRVAAVGMSIRVLFAGKSANTAATRTLRLRVLDGANNNVILSMVPVASEAGDWLLGAMIMRTGTTTARAAAQAICGPPASGVNKSIPTVSQPPLTWANAVEIRLTGEGTNNNDLTMESGAVSLVSG